MGLFDFTPLAIDENAKGIPGGFRNIVSGSKAVTTAGTRVQLVSSPTEAKRLDVTANFNNTDMIVIGGSGVVASQGTRKGVPIAPGNTYTFTITDVSLVWIDSVVSGEGTTFNYFF